MYNIALIFPLEFKKFYVNPYYLQKIGGIIQETNFSQCVQVELLDVNTSQFMQQISKHFELVIMDTPEGQIESLKHIFEIVKADNILLVGDGLKYGKSKDMLMYLKKQYPCSIYGCLDDYAISQFITNVIIDNSRIEAVSGLLYFKQDKLVQNDIWQKDNDNKLIPLHFPDNIIQAYEDKGIQIFMDGLFRGCENRCSFCKLNNNTLLKNKIQTSRIDVVKTIEEITKKCNKLLFIQFTDENFFGGGSSRLSQISNLSKKLLEIQYNGVLGIDTRLDTIYNINEDDIQRNLREKAWNDLYSCGLRYCFVGLETFCESQAFRYNKRLDLSNYKPAISFLENKGIIYTIGLILWDPLMKKSELINNLDFIKKNNLIGRTASLLKIMRIQVNSQYREMYYKNNGNECIDFFHINSEDIEYQDIEIRNILPFVKMVYRLFDGCGYRHSDVALFSVLYDDNTPQILKNIPYEVSKLEYDVLLYLLQQKNFQKNQITKKVLLHCKSTVFKIYKSLKQIGNLNNNIISIKNYYEDIFSKIYCELKYLLAKMHY